MFPSLQYISFVPLLLSSQIICTYQYSRKCGINVEVLIYKCLQLWIGSCTIIHFLALCRVICSKMTCSHQPKWRGSQLWQAHSGSREWTNFHQDRALSHMAWSVVSLSVVTRLQFGTFEESWFDSQQKQKIYFLSTVSDLACVAFNSNACF